MTTPAPDETPTIYVNDNDRYIVSLIVGYSAVEDLAPSIDGWTDLSSEEQAKAAARAALDLTRDEGSYGTHWSVYDRIEDVHWSFEQEEFDTEADRYLHIT